MCLFKTREKRGKASAAATQGQFGISRQPVKQAPQPVYASG